MTASTSQKSGGNRQSANTQTLAEERSATPKPDKTSGDAKSRVKAGSNEGAGGGAKQKQKHR